METGFKSLISRMFRASISSCRLRNISDVIEKAVFSPQNNKNFHMVEPLSPQARPSPSVCKPRCPEASNMVVDHSCFESFDDLPRRKVSERCSPFVVAASNGRMSPPASPISPLNSLYYECKQFGFKEKKKESSKNKKRKKKKRSHVNLSSSSQDSFRNGSWWFSSDDEREDDETETLFSSRTHSSESSHESLKHHRSRLKKRGTRRRRVASKSNDQIGIFPLSEGKMKDSFAMVKSSSDPYNDFRTSMVEMIVEKQIFAAKDLEQLLQCFLSLNSYHHHRIILEAFSEISEALFSL
ncbi:transcription repressor OFP8-like [Mangifera indica]|uniref:transcription repressor OFP8-like n=1 Tax=Mangifera indica TaxID=29780 RepID=UPI001CFB75FE|nr:transcription repressor OFP8-like [Mangifera indica]